MLRIAQIEAAARRVGFGAVALSELLDELIETYQPVAEEKRQDLQRRVIPGLHVHGDHELVTQLFANLIENAIAHSPPGTEISVEMMSESGEALVVVVDDSPAAFRSNVLQRFYRLEASRRTRPGNDLA